MTGFDNPNYTQTPNQLFDEHMKNMGEAELRVTLAVIRKTMGFHKDRDAISYSQIMEMTGLSRTSTQAGIDKAIEHGFIEIVAHGKRGVNVFSLVVKPDQSTSTTSTGSVTLPVTSSVTLPTKEKDKETKQKKNSADETAPYIKAWLDGQLVQPATNQYGNKTNRSTAKAIAAAGYTTEQLTTYTRSLANTPYWKDKLVSFKYVGDNIAAAYKGAIQTPPPVPAPPSPQEPRPTLTPEQVADRERQAAQIWADLESAFVGKTVAA